MNKMKSARIVELFQNARTDDEIESVRREIEEGGYSCFNELLEHLKHQLKLCDEASLGEVRESFAKARRIVPFPGRISPSWERIWEELHRFLQHKEAVLRQVPQRDRDGEWQIVMDNPYTNDGIVCYPGLSFIEAAYLYAYFRDSLKKNEYIRLQKIVNLLVTEGGHVTAGAGNDC